MCQSLFIQVKASVAQGATLDDVHKKITLADFKERLAAFATTDLMRASGFNSFLYPATDRAYQEAIGHLKPESED